MGNRNSAPLATVKFRVPHFTLVHPRNFVPTDNCLFVCPDVHVSVRINSCEIVPHLNMDLIKSNVSQPPKAKDIDFNRLFTGVYNMKPVILSQIFNRSDDFRS